jgi:hypothetical protein
MGVLPAFERFLVCTEIALRGSGAAPQCGEMKCRRVCRFVRDTPAQAYRTAHSTSSSVSRVHRPGLLPYFRVRRANDTVLEILGA